MLLALLVLGGCDSPSASEDAGAGIDAAFPPGTDAAFPPGTDAAFPPGTDAAVPPGTDAGSRVDAGPPARFCRASCVAPADCPPPGGLALYAPDDYACEAGVCRWLGCDDDSECRAAFGRMDYACRDQGGLPQCVQTCASSASCGSGSGAFDADNYECSAGVCSYLGCNTDAECVATFSDSRYVCRRVEPPALGLPVPVAERNCVLGCTTRSDCRTASPVADEDNYECREGACIYTGCNDDGECRAAFMSSTYVCR